MLALLDRFMPAWAVREVDHVAVAAPPARAWEALRGIDLCRLGVVRHLLALRLAPERLAARLHGRAPPAVPRRLTLDDVAGPGKGFLFLAEEPGREVVVGAVGKFWQPRIEFASATPRSFAALAAPGWAKLGYALSVSPRGEGSWLTVDLRVSATDVEALRRFRQYWAKIGPFSRAIRRLLLRRAARDLGAGAAERERSLPGDGILPDARLQATHAVRIAAPPHRVWPWLVQMGCRRAGWYSWDLLDNGGVRSADRIVPELQHVAVGDLLPGTPSDEGGFAVLAVDPGRSLTLGSPQLHPGMAPERAWTLPYVLTWTFALEPIGEGATNLVARARVSFPPSVRMALARPAARAIHGFMERRQLRNLRSRAERAVH